MIMRVLLFLGTNIAVLLVLGVVFVALVVTAGWVLSGYLQVGEVRVPDTVGEGFEAAFPGDPAAMD